MKKIYSILALALALGAGEANAQVTTDAKGNVIAIGDVTVDQINAEITAETPEVNVEGVNSNIAGSKIDVINPNTIIVAKAAAQVKNTVNVVVCWNDATNYWGTEEFVLTDGYPFLSTRKFDAVKASYVRNVKYEYNTLCVPFCFKAEDQREGQHFEILKEATPTLLTFEQIVNTSLDVVDGKHHVAAGTPMMVHLHDFEEGDINKIEIIAENGSTINGEEPQVYSDIAYKLSGSFADRTIGAQEEGVAYIQHNFFWVPSDFDVDILVPAYRCILTDFHPAADVKSIKIVSADDATAINTISTTSTTTPAYNLQGVRVAADAKGFVIMNGKKYFNK